MKTSLSKIKFIPLSSYDVSTDKDDEICAVDVTDMFGNGSFLDWSKKVNLSLSTTYTVGSGALKNYKAGYIWFGRNARGGYRTCTIRGITFLGAYDYEDGHESKLILFPVSIGDYFSAAANNTSYVTNYMFIPVMWSL